MKELEGESSPKSPGRLLRSRHPRFGQSLPLSTPAPCIVMSAPSAKVHVANSAKDGFARVGWS